MLGEHPFTKHDKYSSNLEQAFPALTPAMSGTMHCCMFPWTLQAAHDPAIKPAAMAHCTMHFATIVAAEHEMYNAKAQLC
jgi:hypothetical protein